MRSTWHHHWISLEKDKKLNSEKVNWFHSLIAKEYGKRKAILEITACHILMAHIKSL
jgi:hypothetical protein